VGQWEDRLSIPTFLNGRFAHSEVIALLTFATYLRNYRRRVLLHCGGIKWHAHPATTMRARSPQLVA
jgi:hypothetical protein